MTAKEFLSRAHRIDLRINSKLEQVQSLSDLAEKATSTLSDLPFSGTRNIHRMEDVIVKILDLESEIKDDIEKLVETKREIKETVERVPTASHRTLLELRYICGKTWEDIAAEMHYSVRNVHILHGAALREMERAVLKSAAG